MAAGGMPQGAALEAWAQGWSATREVRPPAELSAGWRIDVGLPRHERRYVMRDAAPAAIRWLTSRIRRPWIYIKVPACSDTLAPLLPSGWIIDQKVLMMTGPAKAQRDFPLPSGYSLALGGGAILVTAEIRDSGGALAAAGVAAKAGAFLVFDRIVTEEAHRRRGLGRSIMAGLGNAGTRSGAKTGLLVATEDGEALYRAMGWSPLVPITSAVIPGPETG